MRNRIFVDTLFIVALTNKRDQYHQKALQLAKQYENNFLITTDAILLEVGNALSGNYRNESVALIESFLASDDVEVIRSIYLSPPLESYRVHRSLIRCLSYSRSL